MYESICTTVEHKIGKTTYQVVSSASESARETIDIKINNIIKKNVSSTEKPLFSGKSSDSDSQKWYNIDSTQGLSGCHGRREYEPAR